MFSVLFTLSILMLVTGVALELFSLRQKKAISDKNDIKTKLIERVIGCVAILFAFLTGLYPIIALEIPTPEIYTTQGDSEYNNMIYVKCDWPLQVRYTLIPYDDPQNGSEYEGAIPVETSVTVSAKACFLGIKWSKTVSKDIVITSDNELNIIETDEPGSSIASIKATFNKSPLFPGDKLTKEALSVEGTTIAGHSVEISDFAFSPSIIVEGENRITITYQDLKCEVLYVAHPPRLVDIQATYTGEALTEGDSILAENFRVIEIYEDGFQKELTDFAVEPSVASQSGSMQVKISKGDISTTIAIHVEKKPTNSLTYDEQHTPDNSLYDVTISEWSASDDLDINGERHSGGLKVEMKEIFSYLGSTLGSSMTSKLTFTNKDGSPLVGNIQFTIAVDQSMFSSQSSAIFSIFVDGEERYTTGKIDASTTDKLIFDIDVDGADSLTIRTDAEIKKGTFVFGVVDR